MPRRRAQHPQHGRGRAPDPPAHRPYGGRDLGRDGRPSSATTAPCSKTTCARARCSTSAAAARRSSSAATARSSRRRAWPSGSLNLFNECVSKIWPKKEELKAITRRVEEALESADLPEERAERACGIGGHGAGRAQDLQRLLRQGCRKPRHPSGGDAGDHGTALQAQRPGAQADPARLPGPHPHHHPRRADDERAGPMRCAGTASSSVNTESGRGYLCHKLLNATI